MAEPMSDDRLAEIKAWDARERLSADAWSNSSRVHRRELLAEVERLRGERKFDNERAEYATGLVDLLVSTMTCRRDRFGNCIAHGEVVPVGGDCPHALAHAFLAGARAHRRAGGGGQ